MQGEGHGPVRGDIRVLILDLPFQGDGFSGNLDIGEIWFWWELQNGSMLAESLDKVGGYVGKEREGDIWLDIEVRGSDCLSEGAVSTQVHVSA